MAIGVSAGKVSGEAVAVTIEGVMSVFQRRMEQLLADHGIETVETDEWYSLDQFVDVLETVEEDTGANALNKLGQAMPETVGWERDPSSVEAGLASLEDLFDTCHRMADGSYSFETLEEGEARIEADTPYPCEFDKGLIKGAASACGANYPSVEEVGGTCRDVGGTTCEYVVSW